MDFILIGGGCYGSFYTRQLLRGAGRIGVSRIHIVDHDPQCRAAKEHRDSRLVFHVRDWKNYLSNYFDELLERADGGEEIADHYVPPTLAPHVLLELFLEKAKGAFPSLAFFRKSFDLPVGTPFDRRLEAGTRALSFATWECPPSCIEPPTCPHTRGPKAWDMKEYLTDYFKKESLPVDSFHLFQCRHYAMGVGTIPARQIVEEYLKFRDVIRVPGTHLSAMATISSCHGLVGLVEAVHG